MNTGHAIMLGNLAGDIEDALLNDDPIGALESLVEMHRLILRVWADLYQQAVAQWRKEDGPAKG